MNQWTENLSCLRAYAAGFPSQGGVEIGGWLEKYASWVPAASSIVEVGCWLGAGTAHLALGAMRAARCYGHSPDIFVFDRFQVVGEELQKAAKYGISLELGENTLPRVMSMLKPFSARIYYYKGDIRKAIWPIAAFQRRDLTLKVPIGLYVDDASKAESLWNYSMSVFHPHFIDGKTILILMDYHFGEKAGPAYDAQKRYISQQRSSFELLEERMGGTTAAVFRYLG